MLFNSPMTKNGIQPARLVGKVPPRSLNKGNRNAAARATRTRTTVVGGNSRNATLPKKNDAPHNTDNRISSSQVWRSMVNVGAGIWQPWRVARVAD